MPNPYIHILTSKSRCCSFNSISKHCIKTGVRQRGSGCKGAAVDSLPSIFIYLCTIIAFSSEELSRDKMSEQSLFEASQLYPPPLDPVLPGRPFVHLQAARCSLAPAQTLIHYCQGLGFGSWSPKALRSLFGSLSKSSRPHTVLAQLNRFISLRTPFIMVTPGHTGNRWLPTWLLIKLIPGSPAHMDDSVGLPFHLGWSSLGSLQSTV